MLSINVGSSLILVLAAIVPLTVSYSGHQAYFYPQQCLYMLNGFPYNQNAGAYFQNVPLLKNRIRHREEKVVRNIPIVHKVVSQVENKALRHVPVVHKVTRQVIECRTRHVPVIRHRYRTVVEKYTEHVPVTETITRPVTETEVEQVPVVETRRRPYIACRAASLPMKLAHSSARFHCSGSHCRYHNPCQVYQPY